MAKTFGGEKAGQGLCSESIQLQYPLQLFSQLVVTLAAKVGNPP